MRASRTPLIACLLGAVSILGCGGTGDSPGVPGPDDSGSVEDGTTDSGATDSGTSGDASGDDGTTDDAADADDAGDADEAGDVDDAGDAADAMDDAMDDAMADAPDAASEADATGDTDTGSDADAAPVCTPLSTESCYTGPAGTQGVGACKAGTKTCAEDGSGFGACIGQVLPAPETCNTPDDDDCDGKVNEEGAGCVCLPGTTQSCYSGPAGTAGVGACKAGTRTCNAQGTAFGPCMGEVLPATESCLTPVDDDCDGAANEGCAALTCDLYEESFDDGNAGEITAGPYRIDWCDTTIPIAANTPLCMTGRTLRTNDSGTDPTIWIHKGLASCTQARITYRYYQFALANVNVSYQQSNDATAACDKSGTFTSVASHAPLQACTEQVVTIPFGTSRGVYVRFDHGTGTNALWIDDLRVELLGCDC